MQLSFTGKLKKKNWCQRRVDGANIFIWMYAWSMSLIWMDAWFQLFDLSFCAALFQWKTKKRNWCQRRVYGANILI